MEESVARRNLPHECLVGAGPNGDRDDDDAFGLELIDNLGPLKTGLG